MAAAPSSVPDIPQSITIISHSNLFYWWPVWAIGFLLYALTYIDGHRMAIVPAGTKVYKDVELIDEKGVKEKHQVLAAPADLKDSLEVPRLHTSSSKNYAVLWAIVLLLVITITNIPLRGMWSLFIIMLVVFLSIIFGLAHWWEPILAQFALLDIRVNAGGYLFISTILFVVWLVTMLFFDHQIYMVFTPGNFKVCTEIGGGEKVYDTAGIKLERQRSDLFRHWILGLGSGDLVVKTTGAQADHFDLPNVLFISKKVQQIEQMTRTKQVVETKQ